MSKSLLVDLPSETTLSLKEFVQSQEVFITQESDVLQGKNVQVENAVEDMIGIVCAYPLDEHIEPVAQVCLRRC